MTDSITKRKTECVWKGRQRGGVRPDYVVDDIRSLIPVLKDGLG